MKLVMASFAYLRCHRVQVQTSHCNSHKLLPVSYDPSRQIKRGDEYALNGIIIWRGLFTAHSQILESWLSELCPNFVRSCPGL